MINNFIKKEFKKISGLELFERQTNFIEDNLERRDNFYEQLSRLAFDRPRALKVLREKIESWLKLEKSETLWALAGMIYYLNGEFSRARRAFLETLKLSSQNADNWVDLAFTLRHLGKTDSSSKIFFNLDHLVLGRCAVDGKNRIKC